MEVWQICLSIKFWEDTLKNKTLSQSFQSKNVLPNWEERKKQGGIIWCIKMRCQQLDWLIETDIDKGKVREWKRRDCTGTDSAKERGTVCEVDVDEPGQSCLAHTAATTLALFLLLCRLHQAREVLLLCLSCLTRCLLLVSDASGCVIAQRKTQAIGQKQRERGDRVTCSSRMVR